VTWLRGSALRGSPRVIWWRHPYPVALASRYFPASGRAWVDTPYQVPNLAEITGIKVGVAWCAGTKILWTGWPPWVCPRPPPWVVPGRGGCLGPVAITPPYRGLVSGDDTHPCPRPYLRPWLWPLPCPWGCRPLGGVSRPRPGAPVLGCACRDTDRPGRQGAGVARREREREHATRVPV